MMFHLFIKVQNIMDYIIKKKYKILRIYLYLKHISKINP